jgi:RimJ/RimL family protein N-acetyltransferase
MRVACRTVAVLYETERLVVRELTDDDADGLYELHRHAAVMDQLKAPPSAGPDEERARIAEWRARGFPPGYGFHATVERASGELVGLSVLKPFEHLPYVDLGWRLRPDVWGRGYAVEAARGAIAYAREVLGRNESELAAVTLPDNVRSRAVMERLGMTFAGDVVHAGLPHVLYLLRPVAASVEELVAGATSRAPLRNADGKSGAALESVVIGGEPYVVKTFDVGSDWLLRASGDAGCRAVALWESGLYDRVPVDSTVVGAARSPGRAYPAALLMRDVSPWLMPEDAPVSMADHRAFLGGMAALHAAFWQRGGFEALMPMAARYTMFAPSLTETEPDAEVPRYVAPGWEALRRNDPGLAAIVLPLLDDPWPLCAALAETPATLLHGDWKLGNLGRHPDGRVILLDWDRPGPGPATADLAWYVAVNCDRLPESKDAALATYREALAANGVDASSWWERQVPLALLGAFLQLGWSKADQPDELAWWGGHARRAAGLLR